MYHHVSNKFDAVMQRRKTVQALLNGLTKYTARMIQQPDDYMLRRCVVSALRETLCNEVLKKGYNAENSSLDVLCDTARMIEEVTMGCEERKLLIQQLTHLDLLQASEIYQRVLTDPLYLSKTACFNTCHHNAQCKLAKHLR
jgi:hypothetical protein